MANLAAVVKREPEPTLESTTKKSKTGDSDEDFMPVKTEPELDLDNADSYRFF